MKMCVFRSGSISVAGFENFVAELARNEEQITVDADHQLIADRQPHRLVGPVLDEVANAAVLIAAVTAIANAAEQGLANPGLSGISTFAPTQPAYFQTMVAALLGSNADLAICRVVQAYCARLSLAQRLVTARMVTAPLVTAHRSPPLAGAPGEARAQADVDPEILAYAWRRACRAAIDCIETLARSQSGAAPGQLKPYTTMLDVLRLAEEGKTPCLEPDGRVAIPGWAERRSDVRHTLHLAATAQFGERTVPVMIRDASFAGLGIDCAHPASPGARITVRLPGDRALSGEVAWANGRRIGIRLAQRLAAGDPLLGN